MNEGRADGPDGEGDAAGDASAPDPSASGAVGTGVGTRAPDGMHAPIRTTMVIAAVASWVTYSNLFASRIREFFARRRMRHNQHDPE